jgi:hypothetical protein
VELVPLDGQSLHLVVTDLRAWNGITVTTSRRCT